MILVLLSFGLSEISRDLTADEGCGVRACVRVGVVTTLRRSTSLPVTCTVTCSLLLRYVTLLVALPTLS